MANNDTYTGALEVLAKQVSGMMGLADANLPFLVQLLETITNERRSPELAMQAAGVLPSAASNPAGMGALGLPGGLQVPGGMPMPVNASMPPTGPPMNTGGVEAALAGLI